MTIFSFLEGRKRQTGKLSSESSLAAKQNTLAKPKRWTMSQVIALSMTSANAPFRSSAMASGPKAKAANSFGPIGPWLVTKDAVQNPQNLPMWLKVNGETMQNGSTRTMVYGPAYLVSYLSQFMSLQPGDVISTGTPPGVGMGMKPPRFLKAGDVVELGVEGLGNQRQQVKLDE